MSLLTPEFLLMVAPKANVCSSPFDEQVGTLSGSPCDQHMNVRVMKGKWSGWAKTERTQIGLSEAIENVLKKACVQAKIKHKPEPRCEQIKHRLN